jgi:hypothetical protein
MSDDNDDSERKGDAAKTGQVIPRGVPVPLVRPTGQQRTLYRLLARLSTFPFFNRRYVESLKTAKEVFEAKNELGKAIGDHQEIRDRLKHFGTVLERGREQRSRELFEEKEKRRAAENVYKHEKKMQARKNRQKEEEVEIEGMDQKLRKALLQKQLDELEQPPPPPPEPPKKTTPKQRQRLREKAQKRYETEIARIEGMNATAKLKTNLVKAAAQELEKEMDEIEKMP